jgi:hypothetical protein
MPPVEAPLAELTCCTSADAGSGDKGQRQDRRLSSKPPAPPPPPPPSSLLSFFSSVVMVVVVAVLVGAAGRVLGGEDRTLTTTLARLGAGRACGALPADLERRIACVARRHNARGRPLFFSRHQHRFRGTKGFWLLLLGCSRYVVVVVVCGVWGKREKDVAEEGGRCR